MSEKTLAIYIDGDDTHAYTVNVRGVDLFSDAGLTSPVTFPQTVSADTIWYAALASKPGHRPAITVTVTRDDSVEIPVSGFRSLPASIDLPEGMLSYGPPTTSGGSAAAGSLIVRAFPFAFDTPGLVTGHTVYTPTVGDVLLDAWIKVTTAWNGTTPQADFGTFAGAVSPTQGFIWDASQAGGVDLTVADTETTGAGSGFLNNLGGARIDHYWSQAGAAFRTAPGEFTAAHPIKICVSTTGATSGADPGATQGNATLYLVTATPAT